MATAVLAGLVPLDGDAATCENLQIASCFVSLAFLAAVLWRRPYSTPVNRVLAMLNAGLTALSAVLGLFDVDTTDVSNGQIGLNFVGTAAFLLSLVLVGNAGHKLRERVRGLLEYSSQHRRAASNRNKTGSQVTLSSVFLQQTLFENGLASRELRPGDRDAVLEEIIKTICEYRGLTTD